MVERNLCSADMQGTVVPPGSRATSCAQGSRRNLRLTGVIGLVGGAAAWGMRRLADFVALFAASKVQLNALCWGKPNQIRPMIVGGLLQASEEGTQMNPLLFRCPKTGREIETGIEINYSILRTVQPVTVHLWCPLCDMAHEWKLSDGLIKDPPIPDQLPLSAWSSCEH